MPAPLSLLRRGSTAALAALALAAGAGLTTAAPAEAASCRATPGVLARTPSKVALAGGATARVWDTGPTPGNPQASVRIVAVTVPLAARPKPRVRAAGTLATSRTPSWAMARASSAVAMVNGGVFDPVRGALPVGHQMVGGKVTKSRSTKDPVIAVDRYGKSSPAWMWLTGSASASGRGSKAVTGLNWQAVTGTGVNVYTTAWGAARRPYGTVDVVLVAGKVAAVRTGTARGQAPTAGQTILTGTGSTGTWLAGLRRGTPVAVAYRAATDARHGLWEAVGRGHRYLNKGVKNGGTCGSRDELLRPRTVVGWTRAGDLLLVTASGRATVNGVRYGGATLHQMADYMQRLGAYDATNLDGGGSTTLLVRTRSGSIVRLDRSGREAQRPVPNTFAAG